MFTRVFHYLIKLKVLNILFIMFMTFSFVLVSLSAYYIVKDVKLNNQINEIPGVVTISDYDYSNIDSISNMSIITLDDMKFAIDDSSIDGLEKTDYELSTDLSEETIANMGIENITVSANIIVGDEETVLVNNKISNGEYSDEGILVSKALADKMEWSVGDQINIGNQSLEFNEGGYVSELGIKNPIAHTISGIVEPIEEFNGGVEGVPGEMVFGEIYMPPKEMLKHDGSTQVFGRVVLSFENQDQARIYYDEMTAKESKLYISLLQDELDDKLEVYYQISQFFRILGIITVVLFIISFIVLNNSVYSKRKNELQLYNVFGLKMSKIYVQTLVEKLILFAISLVFGVILSIFIIRNANNVVSAIIEYSIFDGELESIIPFSLLESNELSFITNGYSGISVNRLLLFIFTALGFIGVITIINLVQVKLQEKIILNQRRGE